MTYNYTAAHTDLGICYHPFPSSIPLITVRHINRRNYISLVLLPVADALSPMNFPPCRLPNISETVQMPRVIR